VYNLRHAHVKLPSFDGIKSLLETRHQPCVP
jgi:hypothetical protein